MSDGQPRLPTLPGKVLLINPPVFDIRFPWKQWQQPTRLLRLVTYFKQNNVDVKLIDTIHLVSGKVLTRKRVALLDLDGLEVRKWRYGTPSDALKAELKALHSGGWRPDDVYVDCFTTFWWEGAAEAVQIIRQVFPTANVFLTGTYPEYCTEHAAANVAASENVTRPFDSVDALACDLSLYKKLPSFTYLSFAKGVLSADNVVQQIKDYVEQGIRQFVFEEDQVLFRNANLYLSTLEKIAASGLKIKLFALGNISPSDFREYPDLASLMKRSGYAQIWLADDRNLPVRETVDDQLVDDYRIAATACEAAGFALRTETIVASVCIGRTGESLEERATLATQASHHIGSVIYWAYQPNKEECADTPPELQNGKMFPLRANNGRTYQDYLGVLGLASVLNSKYRSKTFDFMGDGMIARLFRESLERRAWEPEEAVKGGLQLPLRMSK